MEITSATMNGAVIGQQAGSTAAVPNQRTETKSTQSQSKNTEIDPKDVQKAAEKLQQRADLTKGQIQFSTDQDTGQTVVKVIDRSTQDVLMQLPSKEALELAKDLEKPSGILVSQKA